MIDDTVAMFKRALEVVLEKPHQTLGSSQLGIVDDIVIVDPDINSCVPLANPVGWLHRDVDLPSIWPSFRVEPRHR